MHITQMSDITGLIAVLSFVGGIIMFLFKKVVIEPLQKSIDTLNKTIEGFKETAERRMELIEQRVDIVEDRTSRQEEQIKSIFKSLKGGE
ncbi:hypothetical protein [Bacillus sp. 1NLA3E]|uniref:hypothetical protein n=1 Tax=Bacillus sp. 1NLA3E TaxID=666686 RepID=UPI000247E63E|nr:hypothetical protein [Bacillus sp. 1NLA3E]AGK52046.1 hypothetical protein B1NLA3E_01310 [Bacillus sp. 1NLA3E]